MIANTLEKETSLFRFLTDAKFTKIRSREMFLTLIIKGDRLYPQKQV